MVLFSYHTGPAFACYGESEGIIHAIDEDGRIIRKRYIFGQEDQAEEKELGTCAADKLPALRTALRDFLDAHSQLPQRLDNGTLSGTFHTFTILDKTVTAWNIQRIDLARVMQKNRQYYDRYAQNMICENALLDLCAAIAAIIREDAPEMAKVLQKIAKA